MTASILPIAGGVRVEAFPIRVIVYTDQHGTVAELALTDVEHENLQLMAALADHGRVIAYHRPTGRLVFDSAAPRLAWPDRPDPIAAQVGGG